MAVYFGSNEVNLRGGQPMENGLPSGGLTGQVLAKSSNDDYVAAWTTVYDVPAGGSVGQVLAKSSDDDYALTWTSIESGENDFYIPVTKSGNNYSTTVTRTELYDAYNGGKNLFVKYGNLIFPFSSLSSYYFKFKLLQGFDGNDYLTGEDITINGTDMSITYLKFWKNVLPYSQSSYSGRYLKHGSTANSFSWSTINEVPSGGTTGQVLTKNSNTSYDLTWTTPSGGGTTVVANPTLAGTEDSLTGLQVGNTKYSVPNIMWLTESGENLTLNKTWQEIYDALMEGALIYVKQVYDSSGASVSLIQITDAVNDLSSEQIYVRSVSNFWYAATVNDYPAQSYT